MTYLQAAIHWGCAYHSVCCPWAAVPEGCPYSGVGSPTATGPLQCPHRTVSLPQPQSFWGVAVLEWLIYSHSLSRVSLPQCGLPMGWSPSEENFWQGLLPLRSASPAVSPATSSMCPIPFRSSKSVSIISLHRSSLECPAMSPAPSTCHHFLNRSEPRSRVLLWLVEILRSE